MILHEIYGTENNPVYQELAVSNLDRQYDFLRSLVVAALGSKRVWLSQSAIKAFHFHAITCLHTNAGEYRPCPVEVGQGETTYKPPAHYRVQALMDDFINEVNRNWDIVDPVMLAAYVLWKLNAIHPFTNGNGRTARVTCYYVLCLRAGGLLPGKHILPELIRANRADYVAALKVADETQGQNLQPLHDLLSSLLAIQLEPEPVEVKESVVI